MRSLLDIWSSSENELDAVINKKYRRKNLLHKKIVLAHKLRDNFTSFDQRIIDNTDFDNLEEDLQLYDLYKLLNVKFSF